MRVSKEEVKSAILKALSEEDMRRILMATLGQPKSATELSRDTGIALSSIYRHIHELNEAGLLAVDRIVLTDDGKKFEMFRNVVKSVSLSFEAGTTNLEIMPNEDVLTRFYKLWSSVREVKP